jgi:hypothetical protein
MLQSLLLHPLLPRLPPLQLLLLHLLPADFQLWPLKSAADLCVCVQLCVCVCICVCTYVCVLVYVYACVPLLLLQLHFLHADSLLWLLKPAAELEIFPESNQFQGLPILYAVRVLANRYVCNCLHIAAAAAAAALVN